MKKLLLIVGLIGLITSCSRYTPAPITILRGNPDLIVESYIDNTLAPYFQVAEGYVEKYKNDPSVAIYRIESGRSRYLIIRKVK